MTVYGIQRRAENWIPLIEKGGQVSFRYSSKGDHNKVCHGYFPMEKLLEEYEDGKRTFLYGVNYPLEQGIPLEEVDSERCAGYLEVESEEFSLPFPEYFIFYVSGSTDNQSCMRRNGTWSIEKWIELLQQCLIRLKCPPIFLGATYDVHVVRALSEWCKENCHPYHDFVNMEPPKVMHVIKNACFFVGYQSGLNVLADNEGIPQVELIFNKLRDMPYSWANPEGRGTLYNGFHFSTPMSKVLEYVPQR